MNLELQWPTEESWDELMAKIQPFQIPQDEYVVGEDYMDAIATGLNFKEPVASTFDLPEQGEEGETRFVHETNCIYTWSGGVWLQVSGSGPNILEIEMKPSFDMGAYFAYQETSISGQQIEFMFAWLEVYDILEEIQENTQ